MRIDIVTIFPAFFDVLDVSLIGKARADSSTCACTTSAPGLAIVIAPSTTPLTAGVPAW